VLNELWPRTRSSWISVELDAMSVARVKHVIKFGAEGEDNCDPIFSLEVRWMLLSLPQPHCLLSCSALWFGTFPQSLQVQSSLTSTEVLDTVKPLLNWVKEAMLS
jgi:hypothetical protein